MFTKLTEIITLRCSKLNHYAVYIKLSAVCQLYFNKIRKKVKGK